eukprot:TRINITY_DN4928_c0_g2_i1.p1 TRINITY_DN4928_c0_g2~~TRINITY_DN4928_c0_g2_i1.p1  ORF type:complete len:325 (-),score=61.35 TRINITY_DN4928_c0_g2_i1:87-1061(-)
MALDPIDPFAALGLDESASNRDVESAFRKRALRCHPDRHPNDPLAKTRFLRLSHAKEALLDPARRKLIEQKRKGSAGPPGKHRDDNSSRNSRSSHLRSKNSARQREAAERVRRQFEESLRYREQAAARAKKRKTRSEDLAQKQKRAAELASERERERERERAADEAQRKRDIFEAHRKRCETKRHSSSAAQPASPLHALIARFAASSDETLTLPGPLLPTEETMITNAARQFDFAIVHEGPCLRIERRRRPGSANVDSVGAAPRPDDAAARPSACLADRHSRALERLAKRRRSGEGAAATPTGSWWVRDEAAERYMKHLQQCGF